MADQAALWLRAAAVAAGLAGLRGDDLFAGFLPSDAAAAGAALAGFRAAGDRPAVARALARACVAVRQPLAAGNDGSHGARFLARWMRGLDGAQRTEVARALDRQTAQAVARIAPAATVLSDPVIAAWLVAHGVDAMGRFPTAHEWTDILRALSGDPTPRRAGARVEPRVRACGRGPRCRALALDVLTS